MGLSDSRHEDGVAACPYLLLRPRQAAGNGRGSGIGLGLWLLVTVLFSLRFQGVARVIVVCVAIIAALGVIGMVRLSRARTKLVANGEKLIFYGLVRHRALQVRDARAVDVRVVWRSVAGRESRLWLLVNAKGHVTVRLNRDAWDASQLEELREKLGIAREVVNTPMSPIAIRRGYRGSIPWWGAHPMLSMACLLGSIVALTMILRMLT